jgi:hypothetical protein
MTDEECHGYLKGGYSLSFSVIATFLFAILYIKSSQASLFLSSRQHQFKYYNMSPTLGGGFLRVLQFPPPIKLTTKI